MEGIKQMKVQRKKKPPSERALFLRSVRREKGLVISLRIAVLVLFFALWELFAQTGVIDAFLMSSPSRIAKTTASLFATGNLLYHIGITLLETLLGFLIATVLGTAIALLLWLSERARKVAEPYVVVLNSLPIIALGPIIIIWVGAGPQAIVTMALLISVIITTINTLTGFISISKEKLLLMKTLHANKWQTLWKLVIPANASTITACLKVNVGMSWVGTIMGEYLVSRAGLGYLIVYGGQVFNLSLVMCATVVLCLLAAAMYLAVSLLSKLVERRLS